MSSKPDVDCAVCGRLIWRGTRSLPPGQAICRTCRGERRTARQDARRELRLARLQTLLCLGCGLPFQQRKANQIYCSLGCRPRRWSYAENLSSTQRGYGYAHVQERSRWVPLVEQGCVTCVLCGGWVQPGTPWHLDHLPDRTGYRGVAHASCNVRD